MDELFSDSPNPEPNPDQTSQPGLETESNQTEKKAALGGTGLVALLLPIVFLLGLGAGYVLWGRGATAQPTPAAVVTEAAEQQEQTAQFRRYDVPLDDDPSIGPEDAKITIIEFSDYQCPFCQSWHNEAFGKILDKYGEQVRFVYRDFPLVSLHPDAVPAAEAANCANEQGAFWDFHNMLFEQGVGTDAYSQYASELGLDVPAFEQCISERRYKDEVEGDLNYATNLGVNSTPTFFMNGIPIVGAQPFEVFDQVIQNELAGKYPK